MAVWRPPREIRIKALGLHWRGDRLLLAEVTDDHGRVTGLRPPGGTVEFGETSAVAVVREFREEMDVTATVSGGPMVLENLFSHAGAEGHEIVFLFTVILAGTNLESSDHLVLCEDDGTTCIARWHDPRDLDRAGRPALFPAGLKRLIAPGAAS